MFAKSCVTSCNIDLNRFEIILDFVVSTVSVFMARLNIILEFFVLPVSVSVVSMVAVFASMTSLF